MMNQVVEGRTSNHASFLILVVDDDEDIRDLITYILNSSGFQVISAIDGISALLQIEHHQPDLALLDVMLPGLSGLEVLQRIRNSQDGHTRQMPVVMLSALANKANPEVDQTLGVTKFLAKPFQSADLLELVSTILTADTG
jgi:CheY-like chemotaxis protein